jgi:hypothetical protein
MSVPRQLIVNAELNCVSKGVNCVSKGVSWAFSSRFCLLLSCLLLVPGTSDFVMAQSLSGEMSLRRGDSGLSDEEEMMGEDEDMGLEGYGSEEEMMDDVGDEMEDEGDYGSGDDGSGGGARGGGRGGGSRATLSSPQADAMDLYGATLASLRDRVSFSPLFAPSDGVVVESGPFLARDAEDAFKAGNQHLALALMFGHMTTEQRDALVALQTVKYNTLLRRPVWNVRWGVSLSVRGDITGDPKPIQEGATPPGSNSRGGGFASSGRGGSGRGGELGGGDEFSGGGLGGGGLGVLGGDMGMDEDMGMEMDEDMGMEMDEGMGSGQASGRQQQGGTAAAKPSVPARKMLGGKSAAVLEKNLGLVAQVVGEAFRKRFENGSFGPLFSTVTAPPPPVENAGGRNGQAAPAVSSHVVGAAVNELLLDAGEPIEMWQPGLVFLGEGTVDEILPFAKVANVDLLLHFEVVLKAGRNATLQNTSRCKLMNVTTGKLEIVSKGMGTLEASQLAGAGRQNERKYVQEQLSSLFGFIDRETVVMDMPALTPDIARRRVAALVGSPQSRSLRTLAEIRMYQVKNLLTEEEVEVAFDIVGGAEGLLMLHGSQPEKVNMARQWALQSLPTSDAR